MVQFDEISHKAILGCLREKVMDNKFLELIRRLLKAGVSFRGVVHPNRERRPTRGCRFTRYFLTWF